jgi:large subunit ribosomal protein L24
VKVMRGNERGKEGTVLRVDREKNRVVVEGVNLRKRHRKPSRRTRRAGSSASRRRSRLQRDAARPGDRRADPGARQHNADGTKERVAVKSGRAIPRP